MLEQVHVDYIEAGARIIISNTHSTSRPMLEAAGLGDRVADVNRGAVEAALRARECADIDGVAVAGSISHWTEDYAGMAEPSAQQLSDIFGEQASIFADAGVEMILLEMMYVPRRIEIALAAAIETGLPVWVGLSGRLADDGSLVSFGTSEEIPFSELVSCATGRGVSAVGAMHTKSDLISRAISEIRSGFDGVTFAYPDAGKFKMANWIFDESLSPDDFRGYATKWVLEGVNGIGGVAG